MQYTVFYLRFKDIFDNITTNEYHQRTENLPAIEPFETKTPSNFCLM
jgi:hypothetical protein